MDNPRAIDTLRSGCVIPAHPLALKPDKRLDERRQKALSRYYLASGVGGLAVGVHTTQFAIHDPRVGLYEPVLAVAMQTVREFVSSGGEEPVMIAGIVGETGQAVKEASLARDLGYGIGLLSLAALRGRPMDELIEHARRVTEVMPIMGFYLQQTISNMVLPLEFWRRFIEIPNVVGIKIAPFNRYQTLDVLDAVARSGRSGEIALYTGNDDNIILDLLTPYDFNINGRTVRLRIVGGLLGQWACWTKRAVEHLTRIKTIREEGTPVPADLLRLAAQMTLANKAIFDADNNFAGCIPGISYVLKQQGLLENVQSLNPGEKLSPVQAERIDEITRDYPQLTDDDFIRENLDTWLS